MKTPKSTPKSPEGDLKSVRSDSTTQSRIITRG